MYVCGISSAKNDITCPGALLDLFRGAFCHERNSAMFWIFASVVAVLSFAVNVGKFSVMYALMKAWLIVSFIVIAVLGLALRRRRR